MPPSRVESSLELSRGNKKKKKKKAAARQTDSGPKSIFYSLPLICRWCAQLAVNNPTVAAGTPRRLSSARARAASPKDFTCWLAGWLAGLASVGAGARRSGGRQGLFTFFIHLIVRHQGHCFPPPSPLFAPVRARTRTEKSLIAPGSSIFGASTSGRLEHERVLGVSNQVSLSVRLLCAGDSLRGRTNFGNSTQHIEYAGPSRLFGRRGRRRHCAR